MTSWGGSARPPTPTLSGYFFFFFAPQASPFVSLGNLQLDDLSGRLCSLEKPEVPVCFHHRPQLSWSEVQPYPPHPTLYWRCLLTLPQPGCPSQTRTICLLSSLLSWVSAQQSFWGEILSWTTLMEWPLLHAPHPAPASVLAPGSESSPSAFPGWISPVSPVDGRSVLWGQESLPRTRGLKTYFFLNSGVTLATSKLFRFWVSSQSFSFCLKCFSLVFALWTLCLPAFNFSGVSEYFGGRLWEGAGWSFQGLSSGRLLSGLSGCGHTGLERWALPFESCLHLCSFLCCFSDYIRFILVWTKKRWFDLVPSNPSFHGNSELETSIHWVLFLLLTKYSDARTKIQCWEILCECLYLFWLWLELGLGVCVCACICVCMLGVFYQKYLKSFRQDQIFLKEWSYFFLVIIHFFILIKCRFF